MRTLKLLTLSFAILGLASTSLAQSPLTEYISGTVELVSNTITLDNTTPLNFGGIVSSAAGGTVVLAAATGVRTATGVTIPEGLKGTVAAGLFTVSGQNSAVYSIIIPTATITITSPSSKTMTVSNFTSTKLSGTLGATSGADTFSVGATLNVGVNQDAGLYTGTYTVTVTYQ